MNATPNMVEYPCWQVMPTRDSELFWRSVDRVVPRTATVEVQPIHIIDMRRFVADIEGLRVTRGLESATRSTSSITLMIIRGLDNLEAIFREYFSFREFLSVVIYDEGTVYLSWHDVPDDPIYLRGDLTEEVVDEFSRALGVDYRRIENWQDYG